MVPEDLLFWIAALADTTAPHPNVLCRRHADAMVVPRGWTLDDLREDVPRLFAAKASPDEQRAARPARARRARRRGNGGVEQLTIDGTGEIERPDGEDVEPVDAYDEPAPEPWQPDFDTGDDLDGLLEVNSPLLARAFRGTDRPKH